MDFKEMKARTQECVAEGCNNKMTEKFYGAGFEGWAVIDWLYKDGKPAILCPDCKARVRKIITGGNQYVRLDKYKLCGK